MTRLHVVCVSVVLLICHADLVAQQLKSVGQGASAAARTKQGRSEPQAGMPASAVLAIEGSLNRIATAQEAQAAGGNSSEEKQDKKRDLAAQEDMAFWARAMFWAAIASLVTTAAATILLLLTFGQTRRATFAALRSAVSGRQSVRVARQSAERQLRAYVGIKSAQLRIRRLDRGTKILAEVCISNAGQTTASAARLAIHVGIFDAETGEHEVAFRDGETYLPPGFEWNAQQITDETIDRETEVALKEKRKFAVLSGRIAYRDAFGRDRLSTFRFRQAMAHYNTVPMFGPMTEGLAQMSELTSFDVYPCKEGNEAT